MAAKPCPFRRDHEWDDDGLCRHCWAQKPEDEATIPTPPMEMPALPSTYMGLGWPFVSFTATVADTAVVAPQQHQHVWEAAHNQDVMWCRKCQAMVSGLQILSTKSPGPIPDFRTPEGQQWLSALFQAHMDKP